jgi:hypothetical protein
MMEMTSRRAHPRFAVAVIDNLEDALTVTRQMIRSDLEPHIISVLGQEGSFAGEHGTAVMLGSIVTRKHHAPEIRVDSNKVVSLTSNTDILPKVISESPEAFGIKLLQWLSPEHAERFASAVSHGQFLILVALHSMAEERIATNVLLRHCRGSVEVHDFDVSTGELTL